MKEKIKSKAAKKSLQFLGRNINIARRKRRIAVTDFADRIGVSERTVMRLEKGDPGVKMGTLAMALHVLGEIERLSLLMEPSTDDTALMLEQKRLPVRIRNIRKGSNSKSNGLEDEDFIPNISDEGRGF